MTYQQQHRQRTDPTAQMQQTTINQGQRALEQTIELQRNAAKMALSALEWQETAQNQGLEFTKSMFRNYVQGVEAVLPGMEQAMQEGMQAGSMSSGNEMRLSSDQQVGQWTTQSHSPSPQSMQEELQRGQDWGQMQHGQSQDRGQMQPQTQRGQPQPQMEPQSAQQHSEIPSQRRHQQPQQDHGSSFQSMQDQSRRPQQDQQRQQSRQDQQRRQPPSQSHSQLPPRAQNQDQNQTGDRQHPQNQRSRRPHHPSSREPADQPIAQQQGGTRPHPEGPSQEPQPEAQRRSEIETRRPDDSSPDDLNRGRGDEERPETANERQSRQDSR